MAETLLVKLGSQKKGTITKTSLGTQNVYVSTSGTTTQTRTYNVKNALPKYYKKLTVNNFSACIRGGNPQYATKGWHSEIEPPTFSYNASTGVLSVSVRVSYTKGDSDAVYWQMVAYCHYIA